MFNIRRVTPKAVAAPASPVAPVASEPANSDPHFSTSVGDDVLQWKPVPDHARLLLDWLESPGGKRGWIPVSELKAAYAEMTIERRLQPQSWLAVARVFRRLTASGKVLARLPGGRRETMFYIAYEKPKLVTG